MIEADTTVGGSVDTVSPAVAPPPGNPRFEFVDALRGLAVLLVVFCHAAQMSGASIHASWGWFGTYAYFGVILFFAISGFLLYRPFVVAHAGGCAAPRLGDYARRRILRIVPAYWLALTLLSIWPGVVGAFTDRWWMYYGFMQVYSVATLTGGLAVAWSLCVEISFYIVLPIFGALVARAVASRSRAAWWQVEIVALAAFALIGLVGQYLVHDKAVPYWVANTLGGTSDWFVGGMALAVVSVAAYEKRDGIAGRLSRLVERWSWLVWALGVGMFLLATRAFDVRDLTSGRPGVYGVADATWQGHHIGFGLAAALLLAPAVLGSRGLVRAILAWRPLAWLGLISYGVFLWHFPISAWLGLKGAYPRLEGGGLGLAGKTSQPTLLLFAATLALSVVVAAISYYCVELPILRYKNRRLFSRVLPRRRPAVKS